MHLKIIHKNFIIFLNLQEKNAIVPEKMYRIDYELTDQIWKFADKNFYHHNHLWNAKNAIFNLGIYKRKSLIISYK